MFWRPWQEFWPRRRAGRKVVQRHVLYLGEIYSTPQAAWRKTIEIFETGSPQPRTGALFPEERAPEMDDGKLLLYDLTSTYFESDPPFPEGDQRRCGYSRDKRFDCVQVVLALVVTPEGFPLGYEVLPGNTLDKQTLASALASIEKQCGQARRVWVMDRGIPTEETLAQMRTSDPPVRYLVGTPKGRLSKLEAALADRPWPQVREGITVKLLPQEGECYVFAQSASRIGKERAMRRGQLKHLWKRLPELRQMKHLDRDALLMKLGAARQQWPTAWRLVALRVPKKDEQITNQTFTWRLRKSKLRQVRRREGRYLLRTNLTEEDPAMLWQYYTQLTQVEEALRTSKAIWRCVPFTTKRRIELRPTSSWRSWLIACT
jgi:hypothetical protein